MILIVKGKSYKSLIQKGLAYSALVLMFFFYYNHMSNQFKEKNLQLANELAHQQEVLTKKINLTKKVEKVIYDEAEKCVDLIGQNKIQEIKISKDKLFIVCDWDTDIEPLFVRYGIMALIKSTPENIKISIDLKFIVESNYEV